MAAAVATVLFATACSPASKSVFPVPSAMPTQSTSGSASTETVSGLGDPYYPDSGNGGYDVLDYDLTIGYAPSSHELTGRAMIKAIAKKALLSFNLDLHGLTVDSVKVNGSVAEFSRASDELMITAAPELAAGDGFAVEVHYHGHPSAYTSGGRSSGFITRGTEAVVMGEPEVAATWYPVNDHPLDKATYHIAVTVPRGVEAIVSGKPEGKVSNADNTDRWSWSFAQPTACYLVSMVIGQYTVTRSTHKGKPMLIAVPEGMAGSAAAQSVNRTGAVADFLETQFGPYPFDTYGAVVIAGKDVGIALESQGRPFYAQSFFEGGDGDWVIAHELAHQWFGDSVSVHYWRDIWLNEGFATYAEWLWSEHADGKSVQESVYAHFDQDLNWSVPVGDPGKDRLFDHNVVYVRGALVLHALRIDVGDDAFFRILKGWAREKQYGNASSADFIAYAEQTSGKNLKALFDTWLYGTKELRPPAK